ncbi:exopolysaccharide biosynthesis protein, partial [Pseudonocardia sulfidoxydans]
MANDDVVRLSAVGDVVRGRWRGLVALAVAGAVIGFGASFVLSPGQEAAAKALLQGQRSADQLLTETQIATSTSVTDQVAAKLGDGRSGQDLQSVVHAAVLDGNVIQISATAASADAARALADTAATAYVDYSTKVTADAAQSARDARQLQRDQIQSRITDLDRKIAAPPGTVADDENRTPEQLRSARDAAQAQLDEFDRQAATDSSSGATTGSVSILEKAQDQGAATPSPTQLIGGGAILFALVGLLVMLRNRRRSGRVADATTVEATLGAPVVATVTVARAAAPAA